MQRQILNSDHGLRGKLASGSRAILAMAGLLVLSACDGLGNTVTENNFEEDFGKDGIPPTLTTVVIQPDGFVELDRIVRIDMVASEALMKPTVYIAGVEADVSGGILEWTATRRMTAEDPLGPIDFTIDYQDISGEAGQVVLTTTNGSAAEYCADVCPKEELGPLEGKWRLDVAGVGPAAGDLQWWSTNDPGVPEARACFLDDLYEFGADGSFMNIQGGETWIEQWQGTDPPACGAPVAPHDASNNAIFQYDEGAATLKLTGQGAYVGIAKAVNGSELGDPASAPESVTYEVLELVDNSLTLTIDVVGDGTVWWTYQLTRISNLPVIGKWKLSVEDGAGVGPVAGDIQWWSTNDPGVVDERFCLFDDIYHFADDGSFQNYLGSETWIEGWQGADPPACAAPVSPHDGTTAGAWTYDSVAGTVTINGLGSYLGIPKAVNGSELGDPALAPLSVTYDILDLEGDTMKVTVESGAGVWWTFTLDRLTDSFDLKGKWQLNTNSGAGVGPNAGDIQWWSTNDPGVVETRFCLFDDIYDFGRDGSFRNVLGGETWIEEWQGSNPAACGAPVAPHDGTGRAIFDYDEDAGTMAIYGLGSYLGIPKAVNGSELADPLAAPGSVIYDVLSLDGDTMELTVEAGAGVWWTFNLVRASSSPVVGNWKLDTDSGAGVGPVAGDIQWWSTNDPGVVDDRFCLFDDVFHFRAGGLFQNFQDGETWIEAWQSASIECSAPVAPHDGSSAGRFLYDSVAQTLTLTGTGSHVGIPKAVNGSELADPLAAPGSVIYDVLDLEGDSMQVTVEAGAGVWWTFRLARE